MKNTLLTIALAVAASVTFTAPAQAEYYSDYMYDEMSGYVNHTDRHGNLMAEVWADVSTEKSVRSGRYRSHSGFTFGSRFESDKENNAVVTEILYFH